MARGYHVGDWAVLTGPVFAETPFYYSHKGLDIASAVSSPVYAPADGVVTSYGRCRSIGNASRTAAMRGVNCASWTSATRSALSNR